MLSAGPISHNSIHLLIITTDFVAFYQFTGYAVFIITSFLAGVESGDKCLFNSEVLSCSSGVIMSIITFFPILTLVSIGNGIYIRYPRTYLFQTCFGTLFFGIRYTFSSYKSVDAFSSKNTFCCFQHTS